MYGACSTWHRKLHASVGLEISLQLTTWEVTVVNESDVVEEYDVKVEPVDFVNTVMNFCVW